jgi:hypothetical protein
LNQSSAGSFFLLLHLLQQTQQYRRTPSSGKSSAGSLITMEAHSVFLGISNLQVLLRIVESIVCWIRLKNGGGIRP